MAKILIIEDEAIWAASLYRGYKRVLQEIPTNRKEKHEIQTAICFEQALDTLERERFDIVSLDINLRKTEEGGDGRRILDVLVASKPARCNAVIIVTGISYDADLHFFVRENDGVYKMVMQLRDRLNELFPGRHLYLEKEENLPPQKCVSQYIDNHRLTSDRLEKWCDPSSSQPVRIPPPYIIYKLDNSSQLEILHKDFLDTDSEKTKIRKIKQARDQEDRLIVSGRHGALLDKMVEKCQDYIGVKETCVSHREVVEEYEKFLTDESREDKNQDDENLRNKKKYQDIKEVSKREANLRIDSLKTFLNDHGVEHKKLFKNERGVGWRLILSPYQDIFDEEES